VIRVGFIFLFHDGWLGGINYYRNLLTAIYALPERKIEVVIFTGLKTSAKHLAGFPPVKIVRNSMFDQDSFAWRVRYYLKRKFSNDLLLTLLLKITGIEILSHSDWLSKNTTIPTIGWIPDFQHVHLPEFFSAAEIAARDKNFGELSRYCTKVIVSSYDALADLLRFDPRCKPKAQVLQFVVAATTSLVLPTRKELEEKYNFAGKYFLLPNQFWKHKNHQVVIEALGLLAKSNKEILILSTGNTVDYRHPQYFQSVMDRVRDLGVNKSFCPLGLVPADDLAALMQHSSVIINPSYFEGWSTTVEEAKSMGKTVVLSDIPVHREQNPASANYFHPDNAAALAALLWEVWNKPILDQAPTIELARRVTCERRVVFAENYQRLVVETLRCL
jgi:glycosyltransferase involved in cell wall biosynthesis